MCEWRCLIVFYTLVYHCSSDEHDGNNVEIYELNVPETPKAGEDVRLRCKFRLSPADYRLRTVNWWRDKEQFFTYKTGIENPKLIYSFPGIQVQEEESNGEMVLLRDVSESTSGNFKCEVMGEGPIFKTAVKTKRMEVVVPPRTLRIHASDSKAYYGAGDLISLNCTATESKPRALLSWTVNGKQVRDLEKDSFTYYPATEEDRGRVTTTVGLGWKAPLYFVNNEAQVQCTASVGRHNFTTTQLLELDPRARPHYYHSYASAGIGTSSVFLQVLVSSILFLDSTLNCN